MNVPENHPHRHPKRAVSEAEHFWWVLLPSWGVARAGTEIRKLAAALEGLANSTTDGLQDTQNQISLPTAEGVAIHLVTLQNRMALDYLLAEKGGTCAMIGQECGAP